MPPENNSLPFNQLLNYVHPDDLEFVLKSINEAKDAPNGFSDFSHRILRTDGSVRYVHVLAHYESDNAGKPINLIGTLQDITEIRLAEEQIKASEHRFRSMIENSAGGVGIINSEGRTSYIAPSITNVLGYAVDEFMEMDIFSIMHPDDLIPAGIALDKAFKSPGVTFQGHTGRMKHKDGSWRWIDAIVTNMLHDPSINGIVNNFRDITEKKLAEDKLVYANRLYAFISAVNHAILHSDNEKNLFKEVCQIAVTIGNFKMAFVGLLNEESGIVRPIVWDGDGCSYLEKIKITIFETDPEGNGPIGRAFRENRIIYCNDVMEDDTMLPWRASALAHGFNSSVAIPLLKLQEFVGVLTLYSTETNIFDSNEIELLGIVGKDLSFALDTFENKRLRKQLSQKLKQNELMLLRAQEVANFGSYVVDFAANIGIWSDQFCNIYGISTADNVQALNNWLSYVHPDDLERVKAVIIDSNTNGKNVNFNYRILRKDGTIRYIYCYRQIEVNSQGEPVGAFVVAHDITDEMGAFQTFVDIIS